ncbi:hypothetical protein VIGAN_10064500 [Vigna angularis var. angularis]|uniref:Uncharacterized protein n=1 Tax=Vigna angularis var. angularis TaxID=157739 RepID=A0A0S3T2E4_PHAAN|nr:hypothetical protein VIGAN_10064500 [Vigna angularis var. angularis]
MQQPESASSDWSGRSWLYWRQNRRFRGGPPLAAGRREEHHRVFEKMMNSVSLNRNRGITLKLEACFDDAFFPIFNHKIPSTQGSSITGGRDSGAAVLRFPITGDDLHRSEHDLLQVPLSDSSSSSEADELEGVPAATYCMWTPNSPRKCKKSNSTGSSSKKWKLFDLLRQSNSEGKESYLFLTAEKKRMNERWSIEIAERPKGNGFAE